MPRLRTKKGSSCLISGLKDRGHVSDLAREIERLVAQGELWPGFDPLAIPLVFYDGDDTYLFRFSEVPEGFREMRVGECDVLVYDGRYPAVIASNIVEIAGLDALDVVSDGGAVNISGTGLTAQFANATVDENDAQITVYLNKLG